MRHEAAVLIQRVPLIPSLGALGSVQSRPLTFPATYVFVHYKNRFIRFAAVFLLLIPRSTSAQTFAPGSDPQAVALASSAVAALTGGAVLRDVTLTGTVTRNVTGPDSGTALLKALGTGESRVDLALSGGTRTEIRDGSTGISLGKWINPDGGTGTYSFHNTLTDPVWFFPALGSLAASPNIVLSYIDQETRNGVAVEHLRSYLLQNGQSPDPLMQRLSTMDFYLNASTLLPMSVIFTTHPDNNAIVSLPVEVDFSGYQTLEGVAVPMHIQRYLQGHLEDDIVVSTAAFNTGLSVSSFSVN